MAGLTLRGDGFNLGLNTPDAADAVLARWTQFRAGFAADFPTVVLGQQVHGTRLARHAAGAAPGWTILDQTDGHVTTAPGVLLCVTVADCVPIYVLHPASGTVGLLHGGWRGVAAGIVERGIEAVASLAGCAPADLLIHCGTGICGDCYQVGPEVLTAIHGTPATAHGPLDLRQVIAGRARGRGLAGVSVSPWCSGHDADQFFSHRRSGGADGRMVAYLGVPGA